MSKSIVVYLEEKCGGGKAKSTKKSKPVKVVPPPVK